MRGNIRRAENCLIAGGAQGGPAEGRSEGVRLMDFPLYLTGRPFAGTGSGASKSPPGARTLSSANDFQSTAGWDYWGRLGFEKSRVVSVRFSAGRKL